MRDRLVISLALALAALGGGLMGYSIAPRPKPIPSRWEQSALLGNVGVLLYGVCDVASSTRTCVNAELLDRDFDAWSNWTMIVVAGEPARCVRSFDPTRHALGWDDPIPDSAARKRFVVIPAQACRQ